MVKIASFYFSFQFHHIFLLDYQVFCESNLIFCFVFSTFDGFSPWVSSINDGLRVKELFRRQGKGASVIVDEELTSKNLNKKLKTIFIPFESFSNNYQIPLWTYSSTFQSFRNFSKSNVSYTSLKKSQNSCNITTVKVSWLILTSHLKQSFTINYN